MATPESMDRMGTAMISGGHVVSRRDLLKAAGLVGLGLAGAHQLASWADGPVLIGPANAAAASTHDPIGELAAALDYDADRIFRFVSDEVRYDPYSGILRGARGTLASRAGNSADQALLLAALLGASLLPVRFAVGEIDGDTADALLASAEADAESIRQHGLDALGGAIPGKERPLPQLTPEQQAQLDQAVARGEQVVTWARDQLERTVSTIETALQEAGIELLDGFTPMPDSERARHVWVQVAQTADWVDLDPTLLGAAWGTAQARALETLDALPEDLAHRVELAIIGETLTGDGLEERLLLGYSERADVLAGLPMTVMNIAPEGLTALGVSVAGTIGGGSSYVPVIIAGDDAVVGANPIYLATTDASGATADASGATAETGEDFFESGPAAGETTAQWVELTIRSPEGELVMLRREIFDRLGPARRTRSGVTAADLAPVDRVDLPDGSEKAALPALTTHWLTVSTGLPSRHDPVMAVVPDEDISDRAIISQAYHLVSSAAGLELAVPAGLRPFVDAPNVVAHSLVIRPSPDGEHAVESVLDIWHRSHGVTPVASVSPALSPAVSAGVLAHVAERVLGGEATRDETDPVASASASVGAVFDTAAAAGIPLRVLQGAGATSDLPWADDARARLETSLADGWIAIAPERPVVLGERERVGWWLVDPRTGRTVDRLDDGRGAEMSEKTVIITRVALRNLAAKRRLGMCIAGAMLLVAEFMALYLAQAEAASGSSMATGLAFGSLSGLSGLGAFGFLAEGQC